MYMTDHSSRSKFSREIYLIFCVGNSQPQKIFLMCSFSYQFQPRCSCNVYAHKNLYVISLAFLAVLQWRNWLDSLKLWSLKPMKRLS